MVIKDLNMPASAETTPPRPHRRKPPTMMARVRRHWQLYLVIALPTLFLLVFNYYPMAGAQIAFRNYNPLQGIWGSPWIGWQEFSFFYHSPYFWEVIDNTLRISLYTILVGTPITIGFALAVNELRHGAFRKWVQTVSFIPYFISVVVIVAMMQIVLSPSSGPYFLITQLLGIHQPPDPLSSAGAFPSLYVWSGIWQTTGYSAIIYLAALAHVNVELYDAARIDGASRWQRMRHIDWQAIKPTVVILVILSVGTILSVGFEKDYLLQNPLNLNTSEIISTYTYKMGILDANFSFAAAVGLLNSGVGFILVLLVNFVARYVSDTTLF